MADVSLVGKTLSHYRVMALAGDGGMGVIYRAYDQRLRRPVALKVLPTGMIADEGARRHIRDEALTLSRLNHPNIETVFDFDSQDGIDFLVMEYIEGRTLAIEIAGRPLPERRIAEIGAQIAEALRAAHRKHIVHRDLKPGNIMVSADGRVKVLDFGIAKLFGPADPLDTTRTWQETSGVKGTLPYMAPEQLRGETVDARTDIYALGVVLFEMASGVRPFDRPLTTALIEEICHKPAPPLGRYNAKVSRRLEDIVTKCLEKDPAHRYQSAIEVKVDLERLGRHDPKPVADEKPKRRRRIQWILPIAAVAVAATLALVANWSSVSSILSAIVESLGGQGTLPVERQVTFVGRAALPAISPDGKSMAYADLGPLDAGGPTRIMVRSLSGGKPLEVLRVRECRSLRWSRDGTWLACAALADEGDGVYLVPQFGGEHRRLPSSAGIAWNPDGSKLVSWRASLRSVCLIDVGTRDTTIVPIRADYRWLMDGDWSPSGERLVLLTRDDQQRQSLWTMEPNGGELRRVYQDSMAIESPRWSPSHEGVYFVRSRGTLQDLCFLPVSGRTGKRIGKPRTVLPSRSLGRCVSFSSDGTLMLYAQSFQQENLWRVELGATPAGEVLHGVPLTQGTFRDEDPSVSPDGSRVAFARRAGVAANIMSMSLAGGDEKELTSLHSRNSQPVWSPAGQDVAFSSSEGGKQRVWVVPAQGGTPHPCGAGLATNDQYSMTWAPGARVIYLRPGNQELVLLDPATGAEEKLIRDPPRGWMFSPRHSPDGKHVAVAWSRTPRSGVWVVSLSDRSQRELQDGRDDYVAGWSPDSRWVLTWDPTAMPSLLRALPASGGPARTVARLSLDGQITNVALNPDATRAVCSVEKESSDLWLLEHFDRGGR